MIGEILTDYTLWSFLRDFLNVLAILLTIAVYWLSKGDSWLLWKMENVYDDIIDELRLIVKEDTLPGEIGDRCTHSNVVKLSSLSLGVLGMSMAQEVREYRRALQNLETAEQDLLQVIPHLEQEFPDVMSDSSETTFRVVVGGWTGQQLDIDESDETGPEISKFVSNRPFELLFSGMDLGVFDVETEDEVRPYFELDGEGPEDIDLDEPVVILMHDNLTHRGIVFWDENIPDWEARLFKLLNEGHVKSYLQAKKTEQDSYEVLSDSSRTLLEDIQAEVSESTDTSVGNIESAGS